MSFTVRARVSARQFSFQHGSMLSALDQSLSLQSAGMQDVRIVDADGRAHTPCALQALLFGPRIAAVAHAVVDMDHPKLAA